MARRLQPRYSQAIMISFDKSQLVEKELQDKISLWMLRTIINLGGHKEFIDNNKYFSKDEIAYYLDAGQYVDMDTDEYSRQDPIDILKRNLMKLEKRKRFSSSKILTKNIRQLSKLMNLNIYEEQILEFSILIHQYELLEDTLDWIGNSLTSAQVKSIIGKVLNIPVKYVNNAFSTQSKFSKSSILTIDKGSSNAIKRKLDPISDEFFDNMLNLDEDISVMIRDSVRPCNKGNLNLKDYTHIKKDIDILIPYLESTINSKQSGVNILLYGLPGTGKTELSKTIAKTIKTKLFEISYADEDDEAIDGKKRLKAYKTAQALLVNQKTILMYDEAEDIFESSGGGFFAPPTRQRDKAWINRVLETNTIPTIWITNNIDSIDNALVRRFDMSIEVPIPTKDKRAQIIKTYSGDLLDKKTIEAMVLHNDIAPALISSTAKVVNSIDVDDKDKAFTQILNNTLKAQGHKEVKESLKSSSDLPAVYNPNFINTTTNLEELTAGIKKTNNARICLYGAAGTGKSAFGKYIAKTLDKPVILKKVSDLQSKWVGECEKNIANAFEEAKEEKAVLIFDEVDSFLQDRTNAKASWEVSQVNEMLVQMENFDGIFIATTNLMDNLDKASLRRFDLKLEFDYLKPIQAWEMFLSYCKDLKLRKPAISFKSSIEALRHLTPGDFAAIVRQNRFRPIKSIKDFITRLEDEIKVKNVDTSRKMGFIV
ncbi:MAG: AAA family ATPase [Epsilonproteobacteria bacterium]|nr:MAG: AAA family ATPase [Campylobacterota bacterium]